jgi:cob(I)alamin adenosyltransferase
MDRSDFVEGFLVRMRNVIQKHDREVGARAKLQEKRTAIRQVAYEQTQKNLDAVILDVADHIFDLLVAVRVKEVSPVSPSTECTNGDQRRA